MFEGERVVFYGLAHYRFVVSKALRSMSQSLPIGFHSCAHDFVIVALCIGGFLNGTTATFVLNLSEDLRVRRRV